MPKKGSSKNAYIALVLIIILVILGVGVIYVVQSLNKTSGITAGVHVGDVFTYKLTGQSVLFSPDAVTPAYFTEYNNTDFYRVTITGVNGTIVSLDTVWSFLNGTQDTGSQWINLTSGDTRDPEGFWALYSSNLNIGDTIHPKGTDNFIVNNTESEPYASGNRLTNYYAIQNTYYDPSDPTQSTYMNDIISLYFDRQTGILTSLTNVQQYNNPSMNLIITWTLTNSTVWAV